MTENNEPAVARRTVLRSAALSSLVGVGATSAAGRDELAAAEAALQDGDGELIGDGPTLGLETVAEGLTAPTDFVIADEEMDRRFVVDQTGQIYVHGEDGLEDEPFLDLEDEMVDLEGDFDERGLLGLAFHPDFEEDGRFFVRYSVEGEEPEHGAPDAEVPEEVNHIERLSEFRTADDENEAADPDSEEVLLEIPQPQFNHNAGPIAFGPDDYLYVATGDGGGGNDNDPGHVDDWYDENEGGNGQDTEHNLLGGILRIDVDGEDDERNYGIPEDNPLVDADGHLPEYWSWGHRNPWGMSFENGELLAADVGQALFETINHVRAGGNYAWNVWEGTHCFDPENPEEPAEDCPDEVDEDAFDGPRSGEPLLGPVIEYPQEADIGRYGEEYEGAGVEGDDEDRIGVSIVGGRMYEGDEVDELEGTYVFGEWSRDGQNGGRVLIADPPEEWPDDGDETDAETDTDTEDDEEDVDRGEEGDLEENETDTDVDENNETDTDVDENNETGVDEESVTDGDENGVDNESDVDENGVEDEPDADGNETDTDGNGDAAVDEADEYHPPDEVDLWPIEEVTFEGGDGDLVEDGLLTHLVYAFGRDDDGEVYVLTSDTPTIEGEGYVHRIVPGDEADEEDDLEDDTEAEDEDVEVEEEIDEETEEVDRGTEDDGNETDGNETDAN